MRHTKYLGLKIVTNRILFVLFYILLFVGIGVGGYFIYLSFYDFYFEEEVVDAEVGEKTSSGMVTKRAFEIGDGDYIYTIADNSVARVDKDGNIIGVSEGETILEVKFKHAFSSKKVKIKVIEDGESSSSDHDEEENIMSGILQ